MKLECGHEPSPHSSITTGYGVDASGARHCYACCAERDKADMTRTGRATLYLSSEPYRGLGCVDWANLADVQGPADDRRAWKITNWPGSLTFRPHYVKRGRHNIARTRYDAWFTGPDGKPWHGVQYGDMTQVIHCRRIK